MCCVWVVGVVARRDSVINGHSETPYYYYYYFLITSIIIITIIIMITLLME